MASLSTTVELIFNGIDNASGPIRGVDSALGGLGAKVQGIAAPFADLADGLLKAEAAALAFGATVATLAVRETVKFQDSLYLVQKQLGDSGISIDQARQDIEALGLTYGINANKVAESVAGFLAAGYDYQTAASLVSTSTQLMIAGELDAAFAVEAINKSLAGFRVPAGEAADAAVKVGDILNKIGDISSGKFEEIVQGFSRISPTAKDAGLSMEETAASVAVLVDIFGSGEIAATALKSGLLSLLAPSKDAQSALDALGVATTGSNGELRSSKDILTDLAGKWGALTDAQKQQTAAVIFGKDQAGAMSALLGDWGKQQDYVAQLIDKTTGAVGSMAREVQGKLALISSSVDRANESWRQFLENLGARIAADDQLNDLIKNAGAVGVAFKEVVNTGGFDPLIDLLKAQSKDISNLFESIAKNLPDAFKGLDFTSAIDSLDGLKSGVGGLFKAFFGEVDLTTVDGLHSALQTLINTFDALTVTVTGIIKEFEPFFSAIGETVRNFSDLDKASQIDFGGFLGQMKLLVDAGSAVGLALIAIGKAGLDMGDVLNVAFGGVIAAVNSLQTGLGVIALGLTKVWQSALEGSLALYKLNPFADATVIADTEAKIARVQAFADDLSAGIEKNAQELRDGAERAGQGLLSMATSSEAARDKLNDTEKSIKAIGQAGKEGAAGVNETATAFEELGKIKIEPIQAFEAVPETADKATQAMTKTGDATGKLVEKLITVRDANGNIIKTYTDLVPVMEKTGSTFSGYATDAEAAASKTKDAKTQLDALTQSGKLSVDQLLELTKTSNDFKVAMEEIASNERIKNIEFAVQLKTAQLEADMERVKAAFASIDTSINSTGDLLGSLFGDLAKTTDRYTQLDIQEQIDLENKRRQEALDLQKKLAEAEIERIQAQTDSLNRGDPLIQIDGAGLEPELEAFMWKILGAIRVRANAEFADYLLGLGVAA